MAADKENTASGGTSAVKTSSTRPDRAGASDHSDATADQRTSQRDQRIPHRPDGLRRLQSRGRNRPFLRGSRLGSGVAGRLRRASGPHAARAAQRDLHRPQREGTRIRHARRDGRRRRGDGPHSGRRAHRPARLALGAVHQHVHRGRRLPLRAAKPSHSAGRTWAASGSSASSSASTRPNGIRGGRARPSPGSPSEEPSSSPSSSGSASPTHRCFRCGSSPTPRARGRI